MAYDKLGVINEALDEVPTGIIASLDERSVEAEAAIRRYPGALGVLLEAHDWKFPVSRVTLAQVANDRDREWRYAYGAPPDVASELRLIPSYAAVAGVPLLPGQRLGPTHAFPTGWNPYNYLVAGQKIYTNIEAAVLEYIRADATEAQMGALFQRALSLELAARLVMPLTKNRTRQGDLIKLAFVAKEEAIANARNRDPSDSRYMDGYVNESELARDGFFSGGYGCDWYTQ